MVDPETKSYQMGVCGLIFACLGVLKMKKAFKYDLIMSRIKRNDFRKLKKKV